MPDYDITDPHTGLTLTVSGPSPPSEAILRQLFSDAAKKTNTSAKDPVYKSTTTAADKASLELSGALPREQPHMGPVTGADTGSISIGDFVDNPSLTLQRLVSKFKKDLTDPKVMLPLVGGAVAGAVMRASDVSPSIPKMPDVRGMVTRAAGRVAGSVDPEVAADAVGVFSPRAGNAIRTAGRVVKVLTPKTAEPPAPVAAPEATPPTVASPAPTVSTPVRGTTSVTESGTTFVHGSPQSLTDLRAGSMFSDDPVWAAGYTTKLGQGNSETFTGQIHQVSIPEGPTISARTVHDAEGLVLSKARTILGREAKNLQEAAQVVGKETGAVAVVAKNPQGRITGGVLLKTVPVKGHMDPQMALQDAIKAGRSIPENLKENMTAGSTESTGGMPSLDELKLTPAEITTAVKWHEQGVSPETILHRILQSRQLTARTQTTTPDQAATAVRYRNEHGRWQDEK